MKKVLFFLAMVLSSAIVAQTNQVVWLNGKVLYGHPITTIDSITYDMNGMMEGDTLHLIMPRSTVYVVHDTIIKEVIKEVVKEVHDTLYIDTCHDDDSDSKVLTGIFSVSADKQIRFSPGNLQCSGVTSSDYTWSFAENQYDMIGTTNVSDGALADKIDLFGWSANNETAKWGISTSTNTSDYYGDFVDWGTNTIGTDAPDTWRTLTYDEWYYLRNTRTNANDLVGVARIKLNDDGTDYVNGLILLPDNWTLPDGVTFQSGFASEYSIQAYADYQTFTLADWQKLEAAGAVFLPASGSRYGSDVYSVQYYGYYWSATPNGTGIAYCLYFDSSGASTYSSYRFGGQAVRLAQDLD